MALSLCCIASNAFAESKAFPSVVRKEESASAVDKGEDWKGPSSDKEFSAGASIGYGSVESLGGFAIRINAAKKIINRGFIPDINDQVFLELDLGPVFRNGTDPFLYSIHARWDFQKDSQWTFFAMGGLAGHYYSVSDKAQVSLYPRFGLGSFFKLTENLSIRGELSHELISMGIAAFF